MFCGKALEMIIAKRGLGVLQNKGVWLGYAEGDDLKGYVWGVEEVFEGGKDSTKKRGFGKIKIATILFTC